jgi:transposase-like protein
MVVTSTSVTEQNESVAKGFSLNDLKKVENEVRRAVSQLRFRYNPNTRMPESDVAWDCFTTLYMRGFFHKYDGTKSKTITYLWNGVRNYLIDQERSALNKMQPVSMNTMVGKTKTICLGDFIDNSISESAIGIESYLEVLDILKNTMKNNTKYQAVTKELGKVCLSGYTVMYLVVSGYKIHEVAKMFGVSKAMISLLYTEALGILKENAEDLDISTDILSWTNKMETIRNSGSAPTCPHCGGHRTKYWCTSTEGTYVKLYTCKDCTRSFNIFTKTPLHWMKTSVRQQFIAFCTDYTNGKILSDCAATAGVGFKKATTWLSQYKDYFYIDSKRIILKKLNMWEEEIRDSIERKENESIKDRVQAD